MYDFIKTEAGWQVIWGLVPAARTQTSQDREVQEADRRPESPTDVILRRRLAHRRGARATRRLRELLPLN